MSSGVRLLIDTFFTPDFDVDAMVIEHTRRYLHLLLYERTRWVTLSGVRYWGHAEIFSKVCSGLDKLNVRYKTRYNKTHFAQVYIYSKQSNEVNLLAHKALNLWLKNSCPERYREHQHAVWSKLIKG